MKNKVLIFAAGLMLGVLIMFLSGQRYEWDTIAGGKAVVRCDNWTGRAIVWMTFELRPEADEE